jgi:hypothetical protein
MPALRRLRQEDHKFEARLFKPFLKKEQQGFLDKQNLSSTPQISLVLPICTRR